MAGEPFGDRVLAPSALLPVSISDRWFGPRHLWPAWLSLGLAPGVYAFAAGRLPLRAALFALAISIVAGVVAVALLSRSARRFGVAAAPLSRAAFGPRGAYPVLWLRFGVAVLLVAAVLAEAAQWLATLATVGLRAPILRTLVPYGGGLSWLAWGLAGLGLYAMWLAARRDRLRIVTAARWAAWVALALLLGLVVWAGIASRGFGDASRREVPWSMVLEAAAQGFVLLLPGVLGAADWVRYGRPAQPADHAVMASALGGVLVAFGGALLASASRVVRHSADFSAIPDAAGFAGVLAAVLAAGLVLALLLVVGPLLGLLEPALAMLGTWPRPRRYRTALVLTALATFIGVPLVWRLRAAGVGLVAMAGLLLPVAGVLLADECVRRRGRLMLEELYLKRSVYGPLWGVSPAALVALAAGLSLHPAVWGALESEAPSFVQSGYIWARGLGVLLPLLVAGAVYLALVPVDLALRAVARRPRAPKQPEGARPRKMKDTARTSALADPRYLPLDDPKQKS